MGGGLSRGFFVFGIQADMRDLEVEHNLHGLFAELRNLRPLALCHMAAEHIGSPAGDHAVEREVFGKVVEVQPACGHKSDAAVRPADGFDGGDAAVLLGRKEFEHL
ncbi:hypothetical protein SDC9_86831 [bioreactor metagenome]|uniref:Uncharacterized protein n=1 Tax=bioreactor metagenome TaxID=1076179 RepID=A0A644ZK09_9ZZZZ